MGRIELHPDNTLRVRIPELTRSDDGSALTDSDMNAVDAEILDHDDGSVLETVSLTHQGSGEWEDVLGADHSLSAGDKVDLKLVADGGVALKGTWVRRGLTVRERAIP